MDISAQVIDEDTELNLEFITSDPDGDGLTFTTSNTGNAYVSINGDQLTLQPDLNFNGEFNVGMIINRWEFFEHFRIIS